MKTLLEDEVATCRLFMLVRLSWHGRTAPRPLLTPLGARSPKDEAKGRQIPMHVSKQRDERLEKSIAPAATRSSSERSGDGINLKAISHREIPPHRTKASGVGEGINPLDPEPLLSRLKGSVYCARWMRFQA